MMSTRGTLPSTYVRSGLNEVIHPGPGGRSWLSAREIVFWPGLIAIGPQRNLRWRTPSARRVVVIVPWALRTVVDFACAAGTTSRHAIATTSRKSRSRTSASVLNAESGSERFVVACRKRRVASAARDQLSVRAALDDAAAVKYDDL